MGLRALLLVHPKQPINESIIPYFFFGGLVGLVKVPGWLGGILTYYLGGFWGFFI